MKKEIIQFAHKAGFKLKKHSPEMLIVVGVAGVVTGTIFACKATLKATKVIDQAKSDLDEIHAATENEVTKAGEEYTEEDSKKDLATVYGWTGLKLAKTYLPSVAIIVASVTCMVASNRILKKRNIALAAAYTALDKGFKNYRGRVVERFGENVDRELKNNLQLKVFEKTEIDPETGEETIIKDETYIADPKDVSEFARLFGQYTTTCEGTSVLNAYWEREPQYNLMFLQSIETYANDLLRTRGHVFLNEVYDMLGFAHSQAGQIVGWVYDPNGSEGDNFIDFGLHNGNPTYTDFIEGENPSILLDFNVDGNIWDKI